MPGGDQAGAEVQHGPNHAAIPEIDGVEVVDNSHEVPAR